MEDYHGFESWLKARNYVSWNSYLSFMRQIEKTLIVKDFSKITSPAILKQLLLDLKRNKSFITRSASDQSNILLGFQTYIEYIAEKKANGQ